MTTTMVSVTPRPKPIQWRESPRFGRSLRPFHDPSDKLGRLQLAEFTASAGLFLVGRFVWGLVGGDLAFTLSKTDVTIALVLGSIAAFGVPWMFHHAHGHVRIDDQTILLIRLAAAPRGFYLRRNTAKNDPGEFFKIWRWEEIEQIDFETRIVNGRYHHVLILRTENGQSHPIATNRRVDISAILAIAEAAGLKEEPLIANENGKPGSQTGDNRSKTR